MRASIIVNPTAGSGKARRSAEQLSRLVDGSLHITEGSLDARRLARQAGENGVERLCVVGGDGTFSEAAAGLLDLPSDQRPLLTFLPAGTGGDYRRTFELDEAPEQAARRLQAGTPRAVDAGRVSYRDPQGNAATQTFINVCSFGLGGLTDRIIEGSPKWLGGRTAFFLSAVRATLVYQPVPVELSIDGQVVALAPFSNVAICLGRYFGGGMRIAPDAQVEDGVFDIVTIEGSRAQVLGLSASIYSGNHLAHANVKHYRGRLVEAKSTFGAPPLLDLDGEQPGELPLRAEVLPQALTLLL